MTSTPDDDTRRDAHARIDRWVGPRAQDAQRTDARRVLTTLIDNLPGVVYRCANEPDWPMDYVSPKIRDLTGYEPDAFVGDERMPWGDLIHRDDAAMVWDRVQAALAVRRSYDITYRILTADGAIRWVSERGSAVRGPDGEVDGLEGFISDVTDAKRLEEQLYHAQKMEAVGRLAGGVAHDFNNLLTVILSWTHLAHEELETGDFDATALDEIREACLRATGVAQQLLSITRRRAIDPHVREINDILQSAEPMVRRIVGKGIETAIDLDPDAGRIRADEAQLQQVLLNLAANARDAMPEGGGLRITTKSTSFDEEQARAYAGAAEGPWVVLTVSDSGVGMDGETLARVFEPFFTTKEEHGTGLGLATVYGIVQQHDGIIRVYSEPGRGTTFRIMLPCVSDPAEAPEDLEPGDATLAEGVETILLVEDDDAVRVVARRVLEGRGYSVLEAADPDEACFLARRFSGDIDLLLSDLTLPGSVRAYVDEARSLHPEMRFLFTSGFPDPDLVGATVLPGAPFLEKPFTPREMARKVRDVLDAPVPERSPG